MLHVISNCVSVQPLGSLLQKKSALPDEKNDIWMVSAGAAITEIPQPLPEDVHIRTSVGNKQIILPAIRFVILFIQS